ncbi:MAG: hypothetical protein ACRCVJ_12520 [Clostridium sp.]|uniref:hypothetical protein n=1 Tax=Clostridium sp. TaxID=1506 RepID=UPI003F31D201
MSIKKSSRKLGSDNYDINQITLNELVDNLVKSHPIMDERIAVALKKTIEDDVVKEIVEKEINRINDEAEKLQKRKEEEKNIKSIKNVIIQTLFIGLISGLLINQVTELIGIWKNGQNVEMVTWFWIISLSIILLVMVLFMYINQIGNLFKNKDC